MVFFFTKKIIKKIQFLCFVLFFFALRWMVQKTAFKKDETWMYFFFSIYCCLVLWRAINEFQNAGWCVEGHKKMFIKKNMKKTTNVILCDIAMIISNNKWHSILNLLWKNNVCKWALDLKCFFFFFSCMVTKTRLNKTEWRSRKRRRKRRKKKTTTTLTTIKKQMSHHFELYFFFFIIM